MATFHKNLTDEKWRTLPRFKQVINIASELNRAGTWCIERTDYTRNSLERSLELIDLCINDRARWQGTRLRELLRLRGVVAEIYCSGDYQKSTFSTVIKTLLHMDREAAALRLV